MASAKAGRTSTQLLYDQDAALAGACDLFREVGVSLGDAAVAANISHFMGQPSLNN